MGYFYFGNDDDNPFTSCIEMILQIFMGFVLLIVVICIPLVGIDYFFGTSLVEGFIGWVMTMVDKIGS